MTVHDESVTSFYLQARNLHFVCKFGNCIIPIEMRQYDIANHIIIFLVLEPSARRYHKSLYFLA